jgi:hypothetical protein
MNIARSLTSLVTAAVLGCASADFDKGRLIADLSFAQDSALTTQVDLAGGIVEIVVAVPDGKCKPVNPDSVIKIAITGPDISADRFMKMGDLTWAYAQGSCDAYGYLYDVSKGISKPFAIEGGVYEVAIRVRPGSPEDRVVSVWTIFGGRAPTTRMFKDRK